MGGEVSRQGTDLPDDGQREGLQPGRGILPRLSGRAGVEEPMALPQLVEKIRQAGHELESGVVVMVDDWDKKPVMTEASI